VKLTRVRAVAALVVMVGVVVAIGLIFIGGDDVSDPRTPSRTARAAKPASKPSVAPPPAVEETDSAGGESPSSENGAVDPEDETAARRSAVHGRVTDAETGAPMAGVEIAIRDLKVSRAFVRRTPVLVADDGSYRIDGLEPGRYLVLASAPGYFTPRASGAAALLAKGPLERFVAQVGDDGADVRFDIELRRAVSIEGRVVTPDDRPVAGARVSQIDSRGRLGSRLVEMMGGVSPSSTAASDGTFTLKLPRGEAVRIRAEAEGWAPGESAELETRGRTVITDVFIRLRTPGALSGRVLNARGAPVAGARIWAVPAGNGDMQDFLVPLLNPHEAATSDATGNFRIEDLAPGNHVVRAKASGRRALVRRDVEIPASGGDREIVLQFAAGLAIEGVVRDDAGHPIAGAEVDVTSEDVNRLLAALQSGVLPTTKMKTSKDGMFRIVGLEPGTYRVEVTKKGLTREAREKVVAGGPPLAIVMVTGHEIAGTVVGPDGRPVNRAWISVLGRSDTVFTDAKGAFRIEGLAAGTFTITVKPPGQKSGLGGATVAGVRAGTMDLVIRMKKALTITGIVVDREGQPVVGARVIGMPWNEDGLRGSAGGMNTRTDATGAFVIDGADDGTHRLLVHCPTGFAVVVGVAGGARDVRIVLQSRPGK
jgi:uncharacterized GH25 family protein